jgi:hypothetical protein
MPTMIKCICAAIALLRSMGLPGADSRKDIMMLTEGHSLVDTSSSSVIPLSLLNMKCLEIYWPLAFHVFPQQ